jgi:uncharacterized repeat protein (TIGR03803 family)
MTQKAICHRLSQAVVISVLTLLLVANARAAGRESVLHTFGGTPAKYPDSSLIADAAGNLYGTTTGGGSSDCFDGCGTVFKLSPISSGFSYSVLYVFKNAQEGDFASSNLIFDTVGNLYGTTELGGDNDAGNVFKLTPTASGRWTESVLYSFRAGDDGSAPNGGIVFDGAGNLYGTTVAGGGGGCQPTGGCGTVFELSPGSGGVWTETILHRFQDNGKDGNNPISGVIIDAPGNLYGTTFSGGTGTCNSGVTGCGTVFELSPSSGGWTENVLYSFQGGSDGDVAYGNVIFDSSGNLYGTTQRGGNLDCGAVFELTPNSGGNWAESLLYQFACRKDGGYPATGVTLDAAGNLYGTAGQSGEWGFGTIFKLVPVPGKWTFGLLHGFTGNRDGGFPQGSLILDPTDSHLYGTTNIGGNSAGFGVVFEITLQFRLSRSWIVMN